MPAWRATAAPCFRSVTVSLVGIKGRWLGQWAQVRSPFGMWFTDALNGWWMARLLSPGFAHCAEGKELAFGAVVLDVMGLAYLLARAMARTTEARHTTA